MFLFDQLVRLALSEDLEPEGDQTSQALFSEKDRGCLTVRSRLQDGVMSGSDYAKRVYSVLGGVVECDFRYAEGETFPAGAELVRLKGPLYSLLSGERLFLNLLQRACSIASFTAQFVKTVTGLPVQILDTRKTTPGLRPMEKAAVRAGGGHNHRYNLSSGLMIKDNHLALYGRGLRETVNAVLMQKSYLHKIELEVDDLKQFQEALEVKGLDRILLDNFSLADLKTAVLLNRGQISLEASGGVSLDNVRMIAETGVNFISIGALTQSPPLIDLGMDYELE